MYTIIAEVVVVVVEMTFLRLVIQMAIRSAHTKNLFRWLLRPIPPAPKPQIAPLAQPHELCPLIMEQSPGLAFRAQPVCALVVAHGQ